MCLTMCREFRSSKHYLIRNVIRYFARPRRFGYRQKYCNLLGEGGFSYQGTIVHGAPVW